jgi:hypothetical protein
LQKEQVLIEYKSGAQIKIVGMEKLSERVFNGVTTYNHLSQTETAEELLILKILVNVNTNSTIKHSAEW